METSKQQRPAGSSRTTCSRFWVILLDTPGEHHASKSALGPFKSHAAAEKWIIEDARDAYADSSPDLRAYNADEWGEACAIVEERRRIRPVPTATIKVRIMDISSENDDQAQRPLADSDAGRKGNDGTT